MSAQRSRDTAPEMALRRALHALGFRYRIDLPLPGMRRRRSDLTFVRWRTAVFVQGVSGTRARGTCTHRCTTGSGGGRNCRATSDGTRIPMPTSYGWVGFPCGGSTRPWTLPWAEWSRRSAPGGILGRCGF
ncbi:hypothetical protein [Streptomyces kronopolitis]|uniref:hypothetical protein n=1 Tax=Streptomyces kronopolitis TaxID=1612435 RepID=UPI0034442C11